MSDQNYKDLGPDDVIQEGDEILWKSAPENGWYKAKGTIIGTFAGTWKYHKFRRPIAETPLQNTHLPQTGLCNACGKPNEYTICDCGLPIAEKKGECEHRCMGCGRLFLTSQEANACDHVSTENFIQRLQRENEELKKEIGTKKIVTCIACIKCHLGVQLKYTRDGLCLDCIANELNRLRDAYAKEDRDICQIAGKVLGYPWFKDDLKNFPNATEEDGVCVGDHVAASIVAELADKLTTLRAEKDSLQSSMANEFCNINDTCRSRGFESGPSGRSTSDRVIALAQAYDSIRAEKEKVEKQVRELEGRIGNALL